MPDHLTLLLSQVTQMVRLHLLPTLPPERSPQLPRQMLPDAIAVCLADAENFYKCSLTQPLPRDLSNLFPLIVPHSLGIRMEF
jgi:hypothetical protein